MKSENRSSRCKDTTSVDAGGKILSWKGIEQMDEEEITYRLYLEGKTVLQIARIRNFSEEQVKQQLLTSKKRIAMSKSDGRDLIERYLSLAKGEREQYLSSIQGIEREKFTKRLLDAFKEEHHVEDWMILVWTIGEMNLEELYGQLKFFSKHPHGNLRRMAFSSMGKTGCKEFLPYVVQGFRDSKAQVRQYAVIAFGKIGSEEDIVKVSDLKKDPKEQDYVLRAVDKAIENIRNDRDR